MERRKIEVIAPSRLHFGLFAFGDGQHCFGGVGAMISEPVTRVRICAGEGLQSIGAHADRCLGFARRWASFHNQAMEPACLIEVLSAPRQHSGLGVGTQLGLAIAAGLSAFFDEPTGSPAELAISVGRGQRSAVGTHGFGEGGLIVDGGKSATDAISPLHCRLDIPDDWRFVLISPRDWTGLSGTDEQTAFETSPVVSRETTEQLQREVREVMVPALAECHFERFSQSVFQYGRLAGLCFKERQGGSYNGPLLTEIVDTIRSWGVQGVGQSSWGPTLFSLLPSQADADSLADRLAQRYARDEHDIWIAAPNNHGAKVSRVANP